MQLSLKYSQMSIHQCSSVGTERSTSISSQTEFSIITCFKIVDQCQEQIISHNLWIDWRSGLNYIWLKIWFEKVLFGVIWRWLQLSSCFSMFEVQILHRNELRLLKLQRNDSLIRTVHKSFEGAVQVQWIIKVWQGSHHKHFWEICWNSSILCAKWPGEMQVFFMTFYLKVTRSCYSLNVLLMIRDVSHTFKK